jgi:hypothetical protein
VVGAINPLRPGAMLASSMAGRAAALALWTTRLGHLLSAGSLIALVLHTWLTILVNRSLREHRQDLLQGVGGER